MITGSSEYSVTDDDDDSRNGNVDFGGEYS